MLRLRGALCGLLFLATPGCAPSAEDPASQAKPDKGLPAALQGDYLENYLENYLEDLSPGDEAAQNAAYPHRIQALSWTQGPADAKVTLQLQEQKNLDPRSWAAVFSYTQQSSKTQALQRVDLFLENSDTLWVCRHPSLAKGFALEARAADKNDLSGRGCIGRPWRKLERQSAQSSDR